MDSSRDMYERGVADAEREDLNLFYYQHYYHYRRGYDEARRKLRHVVAQPGRNALPIVLGGGGVLLLVLALVFLPSLSSLSGSRRPVDMGVVAEENLTTSPSPRPTEPPEITPVNQNVLEPATLTPPPPVMQVGGRVQIVNLGGAPLRARSQPGIGFPVQTRLPEGSQATIAEGPVEADSYIWWRLESEAGGGWSAERSLEGVVWLQPVP
ncbi:MAG: hypothetical protein HC876_14780 [Chloroflexaceae bacterium]|nr:hypothetical protein [Chloroflexaceae bacterium]NJO06675.1 hypothetical protein [Chloroflexaceae bacterium]